MGLLEKMPSQKSQLRISIRLLLSLLIVFTIFACESPEEIERRELAEKRERAIQLAEESRIAKEKEQAFLVAEKERLAKEENDRKERATYDRYIRNSLNSGSTPYSSCLGGNKSCGDWGCSEIKIRTPKDSDVVVTIKQNNKVVRHAYIQADRNYTFQLPNGTYQTFFYYGNGWNPEKSMPSPSCTNLRGGFITGEIYSKDSQVKLENNILEYELVVQRNGNFSTTPSNPSEMF